MKRYAILDGAETPARAIGYLFYCERSRRFFIEVPEGIDAWQAPFMLSGLVKRGVRSVGSVWAGKWAAARVVPTDRQNLGMILKANKMKSYDIHRLLVLADGRCAQDDCRIERVEENELPAEIRTRLSRKVREVSALPGKRLLVLFRDQTARVIPAAPLLDGERVLRPVLEDDALFAEARVVPGGNGVEWGEERGVSAERLYLSGKKLDLTAEDLLSFAAAKLVDVSEAAALLSCSRQYIGQLVGERGLRFVDESATGRRRFLRSDVLAAGE